jgi:hypothetical protein
LEQIESAVALARAIKAARQEFISMIETVALEVRRNAGLEETQFSPRVLATHVDLALAMIVTDATDSDDAIRDNVRRVILAVWRGEGTTIPNQTNSTND